MQIKPYEKVSKIYSKLMKDIDYPSWAEYITQIAKIHSAEAQNVLELASGDCKMGIAISTKFKNYVATDISISMLKSSLRNGITKICCDMQLLPFKTKFDYIFSAFDSINYILTARELFNFFSDLKSVLSDDGIFTFDASLENNSLKFLIPKITDDYHNGYFYQRISRYKRLSRIHLNKFLINNGAGLEFKELHKQKIYSLDAYFKVAEKAGYMIDACYNCFTFDEADDNSERVQIVVRKKSK